MGLCNPKISSLLGLPDAGAIGCCATCAGDLCLDADPLIAMLGSSMGVTSCGLALGAMPGLCEDDAALGALVPSGLSWENGAFGEICCESCGKIDDNVEPPAAPKCVMDSGCFTEPQGEKDCEWITAMIECGAAKDMCADEPMALAEIAGLKKEMYVRERSVLERSEHISVIYSRLLSRSFTHTRARSCPAPASLNVVIPATMALVLDVIPEKNSPAMLVLAGGLKNAIMKSLDGDDASVEIISIGGVAVGGRRLAKAEVVFEITYVVKCATVDCAGEAGVAEELQAEAEKQLVAATADTETFAAELADAMTEVAEELVVSGVITTEEAEEATAIEITVETAVIQEAVTEIEENEDYVAPVEEPVTDIPVTDVPVTDIPVTDDEGGTLDEDDESSSSSMRVGAGAIAAAAITAMFL